MGRYGSQKISFDKRNMFIIICLYIFIFKNYIYIQLSNKKYYKREEKKYFMAAG